LWQTRSEDELARQDSPAVSNQVGLYLVGLVVSVQLCFLLDEVEPKRKVLPIVWYGMSRKQLPWDFRAKIDFFAFFASVGTKLLENDGVQIFRPPTLYFGGHITFGTPKILSNSMSVIY